MFTIGAAVTLVGLLAHLGAERAGSFAARAATKPVASTGFLIAAWGSGAGETPWGQAVLAGLALSWVGDVALLGRGRAAFGAGLGSFLLGHVAFGAAFWLRGIEWTAAAAAALVLAGAGAGLWRWLSPRVTGALRPAVAAYIVVILAMVALATGTTAWSPTAWLLAGAVAFAVSDVAVARDRFVAPGFRNRAWGLPLYYGAQLLLAWGAGAARVG
ncbi:MAG: lysoplasmalogenase [Polyangiaceae bacterium]|nr:lysoplasmalogenase [Polyangiaceae bacterium]